jgi:hypothetical protein
MKQHHISEFLGISTLDDEATMLSVNNEVCLLSDTAAYPKTTES